MMKQDETRRDGDMNPTAKKHFHAAMLEWLIARGCWYEYDPHSDDYDHHHVDPADPPAEVTHVRYDEGFDYSCPTCYVPESMEIDYRTRSGHTGAAKFDNVDLGEVIRELERLAEGRNLDDDDN